jgi:hypothetical protein
MKKKKIKQYSEYTKDEFIYEQIKLGARSKSMSHIPIESIISVAYKLADELEKMGIKFKDIKDYEKT